MINGSRVKLRQGLSNVPALLAPVIVSQVSITDDKIIMDIIDRVKRNVNTYRSVDSRLPLMWIALEGDLVSVMSQDFGRSTRVSAITREKTSGMSHWGA